MIIKSMTRKESTFGQLLEYMNREAADERYSLRHNCYARKERELEAEFTKNAGHMRKRANGVYMYHEILSITKTGNMSDHERKNALREIAQKYIALRCPKALVYGVVHDDHAHHLHYHLLISANEAGAADRIRLSRADFQQIKEQTEQRVLVEYSELRQKESIGKRNTGERLSQAGAELKRRTGRTPEREDVKATITRIFGEALDREELFQLLREAKMNLYVRGKNIGVLNEETGRKYRLNRLGLEDRFAVLSARIERMERLERETDEMKPTFTERLKTTAEKVIEAGKRTAQTITDSVTPTDEKARNARQAQEAQEEAKRAEKPSPELVDPVEEARRQRQREVEEMRAARTGHQQSGQMSQKK